MNTDPFRLILAGLIALAWLVLTVFKLRTRKSADGISESCLVISASQTGHAADLAEHTRNRIESAGDRCTLIEANQVTAEMLAQARTIFFVVSTTGEGTAPDNAIRLEQAIMAQRLGLSTTQVAVLALGDRRYPEYCAFAHRIAAWASECGASEMFPLVEVDDLSPADLAQWNAQLESLGYAEVSPEPQEDIRWQVTDQQMVAAPTFDDAGAQTSGGLFRIALRPLASELPHWDTGDLFELRTPDGHLRDYSIASRPGDEGIVLFVRQVIDGGVPGRGSGLLTAPLLPTLSGRVRTHTSFHVTQGDGPLLAIGAGSGWAGLRPHVLEAMEAGQRCSLFFGERAAEEHSELVAEMRAMLDTGHLEQLALALSDKTQPGGRYVQHRLEDNASAISDYLGENGRIVVCGRLAMGEQALAVLRRILGENWMSRATDEGRLRRDLY